MGGCECTTFEENLVIFCGESLVCDDSRSSVYYELIIRSGNKPRVLYPYVPRGGCFCLFCCFLIKQQATRKHGVVFPRVGGDHSGWRFASRTSLYIPCVSGFQLDGFQSPKRSGASALMPEKLPSNRSLRTYSTASFRQINRCIEWCRT